MNVCIPVAADGTVDPRFGRTGRVAVATVDNNALTDWQEFDVGWDVAHDEGTEGAHHARVARFLMDHQVNVVAAQRIGDGMSRMLGTMHIRVILDCAGDARHVVLSKVATARH